MHETYQLLLGVFPHFACTLLLGRRSLECEPLGTDSREAAVAIRDSEIMQLFQPLHLVPGPIGWVPSPIGCHYVHSTSLADRAKAHLQPPRFEWRT